MSTGYYWSDPVKGTTGPQRAKRQTGRKTVEGDPRAEATADLENYRRGLPPLFHKDMGIRWTWQPPGSGS
jgi:hypothetical protein